MAHTEHAKKTHRQAEKAHERNRAQISRVRTALKGARAAVGADAATQAPILSSTSSLVDKAAKHRVMHPNKAARIKSRLARAMNKSRGTAK